MLYKLHEIFFDLHNHNSKKKKNVKQGKSNPIIYQPFCYIILKCKNVYHGDVVLRVHYMEIVYG